MTDLFSTAGIVLQIVWSFICAIAGIFIGDRKAKNHFKKEFGTLMKLQSEDTERIMEMMRKMEVGFEQYGSLIPELGKIVKNKLEVENYILEQPKLSELLRDIPDYGAIKISDILQDNFFMGGRQVKWSDVLADEIDFHELVRDSIYPEGEDTH
jgi:hypothetical protein